MKKIFYILSLLTLFAVIAVAQPKAVFLEKSFDFGNINQGEIVTHEFTLKNEGTSPLKIDKVKASCGCTAAAPDTEELEPGESAKIKVKFDSHGRKGVQKKYVYVFTDDPEMPQMRLFFTTNIVLEGQMESKNTNSPNLSMNIKEVDFGEVVEGEVKSTQLSMLNKGNSDLIISDVKVSCDCTVASLSTKNLSPNEVGFLNIQFDSKGRFGEITRTVTLYTNEKNNPEETIVISANVVKGGKS